MLRAGGRRRYALSRQVGLNYPRKKSILTAPAFTKSSLTAPGAWTALPVNTGALNTGDWVQVITDQPSAGDGGFADDWAMWDGAALQGTYLYFVPASSTGWYRVWTQVDFNSGTNVEPLPYVRLTGAVGCHVKISNVDCWEPLAVFTSCRDCLVEVTNCSASQGRAYQPAYQAAINETGCSGMKYFLTNVTSPGTVFKSGGSSTNTRVHGEDVSGISIFADTGVIVMAGTNLMTWGSTITGEFNVSTYETNLVQGNNDRPRIYLDDFSSRHLVPFLTQTADDSDYSVLIGGGSYNLMPTVNNVLEQDRSAFTTEYNNWFPGGEDSPIPPPLEQTGNTYTV